MAEADLPLTLDALLARQAARFSSRAAVRSGGARLSYAELDRQAASAAGLLAREWKVQPGDRVAWLGGNHAGQLVLLFALARLGAMLVPLNYRLAPAEWASQLAQCTPAHLVHDSAWADAARALGTDGGVAVHPLEELSGLSTSAAMGAATAQSPVLLVFTSGTTGGPKAAVHTQANLLANMRIASRAQGMTPEDRILTVLPLFHVGGLCIQTLPALYAGAQVFLHARFDPGETLRAIAQDRPSLTLQVPATMKALAEHPEWPRTDLSCLRALWAGSSLLPAPLVEAFHARGVPVCNVYGSTETGPFSIALPPGRAFGHAGSCGWPAEEVQVRLADPRQGEGELWVRGPNVAARYWPDTPVCDAEGWFRTGDLARVAPDGSYTIVGRARELIISGGENIHPAEVESALAEHPGVAECAAFGVPDAQWGEIVAVAVVLREGAVFDEVQLREHLAARIARFKLPRRWVRLDALPRTALGKVRRQALAQAFITQGAARDASPATPAPAPAAPGPRCR